ncbi:4-coumarate--CoA ligase-like 5 [Cyphellophora attinorum]|uniref:4-coumarate--CoA ligase-like 5 n=1 Tax=Cyphellophora attinorum TaxID=1664694 RepID=A0A0N1P321_9EURO|nr:4-coumarate--CoA ligase-like 5 [Phialophora attinorum]KPI43323.1 4-coumarate--CoA ligase-like 5 [Phialophora attinorum]
MTDHTHPIFRPGYQRYLGPNSNDPKTYKYQPHSRPIFSSPFGPFVDTPEDLNVHDFCFPPNQPLVEPDYDLFVNAVTDEKVTLHQFKRRVDALSRVFRHDGPNPLKLRPSPVDDKGPEGGEILGLFSWNHIHYPMLAHACFRAELVFGGISPASTPYELWLVLRKMQITALVLHESLIPVLVEALKLGREADSQSRLRLVLDVKKVMVLSDDSGLDAVQNYPTIESLVKIGERIPEPNPPRKLKGGNKLCYLFQSSGTGMQGMITATQTARFMDMEPLSAPMRLLGVVPAYHSYGMILWILRLNSSVSTNVMMKKWDLELALKTIEKHKLTHLFLVPPLVRQLAQSPLTEKYDLSSVVGAASGAAYLPPDVAYALAKKLPQGADAPVPSGYGLSEAASIASPCAPGMFGLEASLPGTIGYLLPGMEGRVVDPDTGKDVKKGEKGELWARGKVVTPGYFMDKKATDEILVPSSSTDDSGWGWKDGEVWLRTGDLVMRDEQDRIHYLDRLKEMIKVKGLQVAATEVEDTLLDCPEKLVRDACVAGVDNGRGDGSLNVRAWVVLTDEGRELGDAEVGRRLSQYIEARLSRHKWLTGGLEVVDSIPRTPSGKMLRREMRDRYHARLKREAKSARL